MLPNESPQKRHYLRSIHQPDRADHENKNHREHDSVLDVLTVLLDPQLGYPLTLL